MPVQRQKHQRYSFFDAFCGAGGATSGAVQANLFPRFALDNCKAACDSYQANFGSASLFRREVSHFVLGKHEFRADILHLSPPCQAFSPANTTPNQRKNEENTATLYSCGALIDKVKPRVFTVEETFGIYRKAHREHLNRALFQDSTSLGYSVRVGVVNLAKWGLPQERKRLIMIGAGPGEKLPPLPKNTHWLPGKPREPGTRQFVSAEAALEQVPVDADRHNFKDVTTYEPPRPTWEEDKLCPRSITTGGGDNYFWRGHRSLTLRELATLQGFPINHKFVAPGVMKQIGNAFPPIAAKHLFETIEKFLLKEDNIIIDNEDDVVMIDVQPVPAQPAPTPPEAHSIAGNNMDMDTGGDDDSAIEIWSTRAAPVGDTNIANSGRMVMA